MHRPLTVDPPRPLTLEDVPLWRLSVEEYLDRVRTGRIAADTTLLILDSQEIAHVPVVDLLP